VPTDEEDTLSSFSGAGPPFFARSQDQGLSVVVFFGHAPDQIRYAGEPTYELREEHRLGGRHGVFFSAAEGRGVIIIDEKENVNAGGVGPVEEPLPSREHRFVESGGGSRPMKGFSPGPPSPPCDRTAIA
jgi:hypothetical protein